MKSLETERLVLRPWELEDADFVTHRGQTSRYYNALCELYEAEAAG